MSKALSLASVALALAVLAFIALGQWRSYVRGQREFRESDFAEAMHEGFIPAYYLRFHHWPGQFGWLSSYLRSSDARQLYGPLVATNDEARPRYRILNSSPNDFAVAVEFLWPQGRTLTVDVHRGDEPIWAKSQDNQEMAKLLAP